MSLDAYLNGESREVDCTCGRCFNEHKHTETDNLYSANITHNLGKMAGAAGIYYALWQAGELLDPTTAALIRAAESAGNYHDAGVCMS